MKPYFQSHQHHNISHLAQQVSDIAQEVGDIVQAKQISKSLLRHNKIAKSANPHKERSLSSLLQQPQAEHEGPPKQMFRSLPSVHYYANTVTCLHCTTKPD